MTDYENLIGLTLQTTQWVAALIVLADSVNRLEDCKAMGKGLLPRQRVWLMLKGMAFAMLAIASCGELVAPALHAANIDAGILVDHAPDLSESFCYYALAIFTLHRWFELYQGDQREKEERNCPCQNPAHGHAHGVIKTPLDEI